MVSGIRLVAGGCIVLALGAGCAAPSRSTIRGPATAAASVAPPSAAAGSETLGGESLQVSDKQIDNHIDQVLAARGVTKEEVLAMSEAKVDPALIVNHIHSRGVSAPLSTEDLILLQQSGVNSQVIAAMQNAAAPPQRTVLVRDHYIPTIVGVRPVFGPPVIYHRLD